MQIASTRRAAILPDAASGNSGRGSVAYGASAAGSAAAGAGASALSHLSMYAEPPDMELTLEDFEVAAFDRLRGT
jgi:hypothetical protein